MDSEKLIERLSKYSEPVIAYKLDADFAASITDAISELRGKCDGCSVPATTAEMIWDLNDAPKLRAENEKLRAEMEQKEKYYEQMVDALAATESAELEQVKAERDAAISDLETIMAYGGGNLDTCQYCKNGQCYARGGTKLCLPQWRGPKED